MKTAKLLLFSLCFLALLPLQAWACRCASWETDSTRYDSHDAVVVARVVDAVTDRHAPYSFRLEVLQSWKTGLPRTVTVFTDDWHSSCEYKLSKQVYLLYLSRDRQGEFHTSQCSGNIPLGNEGYQAAIRWLEQNAKSIPPMP
jgi:hypothetical protein